jgi:hypothetical protein
LVEDILVGASLFGSIGVPGRCRNSFGYGSDGEIALENYYYVPDGRFDPFKMETGDFGTKNQASIFCDLTFYLMFQLVSVLTSRRIQFSSRGIAQ